MTSSFRLPTLLATGLLATSVIVACGAGSSSPAATPETSGSGDDAGATPATDALASLSESELRRTVSVLAADDMMGRDEGTAESKKARAFLIEELTKCGVLPAVDGSFEQPIVGGKGTNILGRIDGTDPDKKARTIVVGAHYDHIGECGGKICNGADDNAAGVSIAVAVACAVARAPLARSVLVALWDSEEPPTFLSGKMGSQYYATHPVVPLADTDAAIALDLVGSDLWPNHKGHFVMGGELSPEVATALDAATVPDGLKMRRFGLHLAEETPFGHQPWSDYDAFRNAKVPIVFLSNGQNKRYHQPSDEVASLDLPKMALEATYLHRVVKELGNAANKPTFVAAGANHTLDAASVQAILEEALAPGGLVDALGLSANTRTKLQGELAGIKKMNGPTLAEGDVTALRLAAQRVMCLAGPQYAEGICTSL